MKLASSLSLLALLATTSGAALTCPTTATSGLKECCGDESKCTYEICHPKGKLISDTDNCDVKYCETHPSAKQCWDPKDAAKQC